MKSILSLLILALGLPAALAQSYSLSWFTLDGGGGVSTGGVFAVNGTVGQPDAGVMTGGNFSLAGGFWGVVIPVQQSNAPVLFIANLQNGAVKVSWSPNTPEFVLQEAADLNPLPVAWTNAPAAWTNGAVLPAASQTRYFRLSKP